MTDGLCKVNDCTSSHKALGFCQKHYSRFRAHGDPLHERTTWDRRGRSSALLVTLGDTFGRWTVTGQVVKQEDGQARFPCKCQCGTERDVLFRVLTQSLKGKTSGSCGCAQKEFMATKRKHGVGPNDPGYHRARYLWSYHRITPQDVRDMLEKQNSLCMICEEPITEESCRLDHDHKTNERRSLLCHHCNVGIGHFKDDIVLLQSAIDYLKSHSTP